MPRRRVVRAIAARQVEGSASCTYRSHPGRFPIPSIRGMSRVNGRSPPHPCLKSVQRLRRTGARRPDWRGAHGSGSRSLPLTSPRLMRARQQHRGILRGPVLDREVRRHCRRVHRPSRRLDRWRPTFRRNSDGCFHAQIALKPPRFFTRKAETRISQRRQQGLRSPRLHWRRWSAQGGRAHVQQAASWPRGPARWVPPGR